jgi:glycosyltransferase involved in cell wall biosynthesis
MHNHRIILIVNVSSQSLRRILSKAKIYVHCAPHEYFGISVVEAMACGCVPVVHKSGGPYTDIIEYDEYGFSFESAHELASKINLLLNNNDLYEKFSERAQERSKMFNRENFKKHLIDTIKS